MPVEEVETTETIEKKTTEEVTICDACGVNNDSDSRIYTFLGQTLNQNLYFCAECLENGNTDPMTDRISTTYIDGNEDPTEISVHVIMSFIGSSILGYGAGGLGGIVAGGILMFVLIAVGLLITKN